MSEQNTRLFEEFPEVSPEQWEQSIIQDLKGADYEKKLIGETIDGIKIKPFYTADDILDSPFTDLKPGEFPFLRGNSPKQSPEIRQNIYVEDFEKAAAKSLEIINCGADSVEFILIKKENIDINNFETLFSEIDITKTPAHLRAEKYSSDILETFIEYCEKKYQSTEKIKGSLNFDLSGFQAISGVEGNESGTKVFQKIKPVLEKIFKKLPDFKPVTINGQFFREAGASPVQELAFSFSSAVETLNYASLAGIDTEKLIPCIAFNFGNGSDYFEEIAKIRAARVIWAKISESYYPGNPEIAKMYIHCVTCDTDKTLYDPHVNILRTTTQAMSAILGGTDSLTVRPFDSTYKISDEFSQRIARNISIVLKEEAYLDKITDIAGGAYFIEYLTGEMIEKTWNLFMEIENSGGYSESLKKGIIQNKIEEKVQKQMMNIAQRKKILLGTNQYAFADEKAAINVDEKIYQTDRFAEIKKDFKPLKKFRAAAQFEEIRLKIEKSVIRPKVFLLTFGNPTMRKTRASFAANFFACAGFEIIDNSGFANIKEGADAAISQNAHITVACSADDEYSKAVPEIYKDLKGKSILAVAGYPIECVEDLKSIGVTNFIHIKSNIIEELRKYCNLIIKN